MPQAYIDHEAARRVLETAIPIAKSSGYRPQHPKASLIANVMLGGHLTYRYVLFTNLLAKTVNSHANGLALQAGANLNGAFDSRSLCHDVVVDFDRSAEYLAGKLGLSNEPYLNKPARYPAISSENAVRRGRDRTILETCIDILGGLEGQADARAALEDAIFYTMQRQTLVAEASEIDGDAALHNILVKFAKDVLYESNEGESCAILVGLAFYVQGRSHGRDFDIRIHPVNQAGSSSREVLDIDVYERNSLRYTAEVKDKIFTVNDVDHAARKVRAAGVEQFFFVCGPRSDGAYSAQPLVETVAVEQGVRVVFVDVDQFFSTSLGFAPPDLSSEEVWGVVEAIMNGARVKDQTRTHLIRCARQAGLID